MAEESFKTLVEAVSYALMRGGNSVLTSPQRFLSYLCDTMDQDGVEMRVLMRCCDDEFLGHYRNVSGSDATALRDAAARAYDYLVNSCMIEQRTAAFVSQGIAEGIARRNGVTLMRQQASAPAPQPAVAPAPQPVVTPVPQKTVAPAPQPAAETHVSPVGRTGTQLVTSPMFEQSQPKAVTPAPVQPAPQPQPATPAPVQPAPQPGAQQGTPVQTNGSKRKTPVAAIAAAVALLVVGLLGWRLLSSGSGDNGGTRGLTGTTDWLAPEEDATWVLTSSVTVDAGGTTTYEFHASYDEHGNRLSSTSFSLNEDGDKYDSSYTYYDYDEYGYPGSYVYQNSSVYSDGSTYDSTTTCEYTYNIDNAGRATTREVSERYESDGYITNTNGKYTYTYDNNTIILAEWIENQSSSGLNYRVVGSAAYDEYGNSISYSDQTTYSDGDTYEYSSTSDYKLASDGTPISEVYTARSVSSYSDGEESTWTTEYTFDEHGVVVYSKETNDDGEVTITEYKNEYDRNGNLAKRTNLTDGSVTTYERQRIDDPSFAVRNSIAGKL